MIARGRVVDLDDRDARGGDPGGAAPLDDETGGAALRGLLGELVAVEALAADGEPQPAGRHRATVDRQTDVALGAGRRGCSGAAASHAAAGDSDEEFEVERCGRCGSHRRLRPWPQL